MISSKHAGDLSSTAVEKEEHRSVNDVNAKAVMPYGHTAGIAATLPLKVTDNGDGTGTLVTSVTSVGGSEAVTIADGADVTQGAIADVAYTSGSGTVVSLLKGLFSKLGSILTTQTDKSQFTKITDGTDTALVTTAGEQNVLATAQPGVDIGDVTINNASGASAVNIQDGGNSITVDGSVTANAGTNLNTSALALSATQTDGTQKSIVRGGAKGATTAADVTSTSQSADRNALDVQIRTSAGAVVDTFGGGTQFADGTARGTATGTLAMVDDGTNVQSMLGDTSGRQIIGSETFTKKSVTASASGDTTLHTPAAGKIVRLHFFGYSAGSNVTGVLAGLKFAAGGTVFDQQYLSAAGQPYARNIQAGKRYVQGTADQALIVNLNGAQTVYCNIEIEEI